MGHSWFLTRAGVFQYHRTGRKLSIGHKMRYLHRGAAEGVDGAMWFMSLHKVSRSACSEVPRPLLSLLSSKLGTGVRR